MCSSQEKCEECSENYELANNGKECKEKKGSSYLALIIIICSLIILLIVVSSGIFMASKFCWKKEKIGEFSNKNKGNNNNIETEQNINKKSLDNGNDPLMSARSNNIGTLNTDRYNLRNDNDKKKENDFKEMNSDGKNKNEYFKEDSEDFKNAEKGGDSFQNKNLSDSENEEDKKSFDLKKKKKKKKDKKGANNNSDSIIAEPIPDENFNFSDNKKKYLADYGSRYQIDNPRNDNKRVFTESDNFFQKRDSDLIEIDSQDFDKMGDGYSKDLKHNDDDENIRYNNYLNKGNKMGDLDSNN